jgi:hypothetical protein
MRWAPSIPSRISLWPVGWGQYFFGWREEDGWRVKRMRGEEGKLKGDVNLRTREWHQDEKTDNPVV